MTVVIRFTKIVPKFNLHITNLTAIATSFVSGQSNTWNMIRMAMEKAKREGYAPDMDYIIEYKSESEDIVYKKESMTVKIRGNQIQESHEYNLIFNFVSNSLIHSLPKLRDTHENPYMMKSIRENIDKLLDVGTQNVGLDNTNNILNKFAITVEVLKLPNDEETYDRVQGI